jgi:hypothetical protein
MHHILPIWLPPGSLLLSAWTELVVLFSYVPQLGVHERSAVVAFCEQRVVHAAN